MNLRILKKLSKRAVPLLHQIGETRTVFPAEKEENYHGMIIRDMTRLERFGSSNTDKMTAHLHVATIAPKCRQGTRHPYVKCYLSPHPIKGTPMVGGMSGYYEPEWSEETAYGVLLRWVRNNFFKYDPKTENCRFTGSFKNSSDVFRAATELLSQKQPHLTK